MWRINDESGRKAVPAQRCGKGEVTLPLPPEPDWRISRIRLSGRWGLTVRLGSRTTGFIQAEESVAGKIGVLPSLMIAATTAAAQACALAQDGTEAAAHPSVDLPQRGRDRMAKVAIPAAQPRVELRDDLAQAFS